MIQLKNKFIKIATLFLLTVIVASFNSKYFVFDGGTITNPVIAIPLNAAPPEIRATNASGCADTVIYQCSNQQMPLILLIYPMLPASIAGRIA